MTTPDPWPDDLACQVSDPNLMPNQLPSPSADSRYINEEQFPSTTTKTVEVDGKPLHELETAAQQDSLSSSQSPSLMLDRVPLHWLWQTSLHQTV